MDVEVRFRAFTVPLKLTTCRCPRIGYPSLKCGGRLQKAEGCHHFRVFEMFLKAEDVTTTEGKLICSYFRPAIENPNLVFDDKNFLSELVNPLVHMNHDDLHAAGRKEQSSVFEDAVHLRFTTELLAAS